VNSIRRSTAEIWLQGAANARICHASLVRDYHREQRCTIIAGFLGLATLIVVLCILTVPWSLVSVCLTIVAGVLFAGAILLVILAIGHASAARGSMKSLFTCNAHTTADVMEAWRRPS
jgi:hypothetical protein